MKKVTNFVSKIYLVGFENSWNNGMFFFLFKVVHMTLPNITHDLKITIKHNKYIIVILM